MKIGIFGATLFHQGAEYVMAAQARGFAARGHEVHVILSKYHEVWRLRHPEASPFELPSNVIVHVLPHCRARYNVFALSRLMRALRFDVLISNASFAAVAIAKTLVRNPPLLINVEHAGGIGLNKSGTPSLCRISPHAYFRNLLYSCFDIQFAVSAGNRIAMAKTENYPLERIVTVYNPVVDELFEIKRSMKPKHPWLCASSRVPVIVAAGAFCDCKNHALLLRSFSLVVKHHPCRLVIFGDGPLRHEYETLVKSLDIAEYVSFPGFTNNLPAELNNASCFVCSSKFESFSVVLVEALACGVPCVSTDAPYGPSEVLDNGRYGLLVPNYNETALAEAIMSVLNHTVHIQKNDLSWSRFTGERYIRRCEDAICKALRR